MKKTILTVLACIVILILVIVGGSDPSKKLDDYEKYLPGANANATKDNGNYLREVADYRKVILETTISNERVIADIELRINHNKKSEIAVYSKQITSLQQMNADQQRKLDDYVADDESEWKLFKAGFDLDMYKLDKDLKDLRSNMEGFAN